MQLSNKLLFGLAFSVLSTHALAHDQNGDLGLAQGTVDYYQVHCYDDGSGAPGYLELAVQDLPPALAPVVSMQVTRSYKVGTTLYNKIASTTDNKEDAAYSPEIIAQWIAPTENDAYFFVMINKNKAATDREKYTFAYHCMTATNEHTGTDILQLQNQ
jgi:hypothetical protein